MIICQCAVVSDRAVHAAVDAGCTGLGAVCRSTGAGRDCGGCVLAVREVIATRACPHSVEVEHLGELTGLSGVEATAAELEPTSLEALPPLAPAASAEVRMLERQHAAA